MIAKQGRPIAQGLKRKFHQETRQSSPLPLVAGDGWVKGFRPHAGACHEAGFGLVGSRHRRHNTHCQADFLQPMKKPLWDHAFGSRDRSQFRNSLLEFLGANFPSLKVFTCSAVDKKCACGPKKL